MRVRILEVSEGRGRMEVEFATRFGNARGLWMSAPPAPLQEYDVELQVDQSLRWGREIVETPGEEPALESLPRGVRLRGTLDSISEDGVVAVRFDQSILLIETEGNAPRPGVRVSLTVEEIKLFDVKL